LKSSPLQSLFSTLPLKGYDFSLDLSAWLRWWGEGLLACLPPSVHRLLVELPLRLSVEIRAQEIGFLREENGESQELESYPLDVFSAGGLRERGSALLGNAKQVILRLPADKVLTKVISLPLAVETNLRQVVGFEIDRLTPFSAEQIYYDVAILQRQTELKRIKLKFIAVTKSLLEPLLSRLLEMGLPPDQITVAGEEAGINLLPPEQRPNKNRYRQRLRWVTLGLAGVLLSLASLLPVWQQRSLVVDLLPKVAAAQKEAEQILMLRKELEDSLESSRFLFQKRQETILVIDLINELTSLFPDGTSVEHLEIRDNEVRVRGQSSGASALIGLLETSKYFHGVTFLAPVTADRATGQERFYIAAQIAREPR
jgi:general secretion pathway protein L